jgi:hypothetical protein
LLEAIAGRSYAYSVPFSTHHAFPDQADFIQISSVERRQEPSH